MHASLRSGNLAINSVFFSPGSRGQGPPQTQSGSVPPSSLSSSWWSPLSIILRPVPIACRSPFSQRSSPFLQKSDARAKTLNNEKTKRADERSIARRLHSDKGKFRVARHTGVTAAYERKVIPSVFCLQRKDMEAIDEMEATDEI